MLFDFARRIPAVRALLRRIIGRRTARRRTTVPPKAWVNRIVSDAIQFNEIPSPTEHEAERAAFIARRLGEFGLTEVTVGPEGSVGCLIPSAEPTGKGLLLLANTSNPDFSPLESLVRLTERQAAGNGIADNSLGVSSLLVLAEYLGREQVALPCDVVLFFSPMARGGDVESFVRERAAGCGEALFVTGLSLGDVEVKQLGTCALLVAVRTPESAGASAVSVLSAMATRLSSIRWSADNETVLRVARVEAGIGLGYFAAEGTMDVEIVSPSAGLLHMARDAAIATIRGTAAETGASVEIEESTAAPPDDSARRRLLVETLQQVHRELGIRSRTVVAAPRRPYLGLLGLPVLSVGITTGHKSLSDEAVDLAPIETGFRQLLLLARRLAETEPGEAA